VKLEAAKEDVQNLREGMSRALSTKVSNTAALYSHESLTDIFVPDATF
jgi:hypothetical protein